MKKRKCQARMNQIEQDIYISSDKTTSQFIRIQVERACLDFSFMSEYPHLYMFITFIREGIPDRVTFTFAIYIHSSEMGLEITLSLTRLSDNITATGNISLSAIQIRLLIISLFGTA